LLARYWRRSASTNRFDTEATFLSSSRLTYLHLVYSMPTMHDVAKRAGVALSTVSYALNGTRPISEETRLRILAAMEELGYHPNLLARSLSTKRSRIIGLLIPSDMHGALSVMQANFVASAVRVASQRGYGLLIWTLPEEQFDVRRMVQEGLVEGLVLMEVKLNDERVVKLRASNYRFALIGHCADNSGISYVDFDFDAGLRMAVKHLVELGHTAVAFINFAQHAVDTGYGPAVRSTDGFQSAIAEQGIKGMALIGPSVMEDATGMVRNLLVEHPHITSVIVPDVPRLSAVMQAAYQLKLRIPDDLSVLSLLDEDVAGRTAPPLTNIVLPSEAMGRIGAELLIDQLEDPATPVRQLLLPPQLHIGQSTAPPRDRAFRGSPTTIRSP
jgi:DNA-binding LacI/PurR family transcriptional regulator